jgi:hypothetical protein
MADNVWNEGKEDSTDLSPVENMLDRKSRELEQKGTKGWTSGTCRKPPIIKKDDFLWSTV